MTERGSSGFSFHCVGDVDVLCAISSLKSDSIGFDSIPLRFLKMLLPCVLPVIVFIFNTIFTNSVFPDIRKISKFIPIPGGCDLYSPYLYVNLQFARSSRTFNLMVPFGVCRARRQSFFVRIVNMWNVLPIDIKRSFNLHTFKRKCIEYFGLLS